MMSAKLGVIIATNLQKVSSTMAIIIVDHRTRSFIMAVATIIDLRRDLKIVMCHQMIVLFAFTKARQSFRMQIKRLIS